MKKVPLWYLCFILVSVVAVLAAYFGLVVSSGVGKNIAVKHTGFVSDSDKDKTEDIFSDVEFNVQFDKNGESIFPFKYAVTLRNVKVVFDQNPDVHMAYESAIDGRRVWILESAFGFRDTKVYAIESTKMSANTDIHTIDLAKWKAFSLVQMTNHYVLKGGHYCTLFFEVSPKLYEEPIVGTYMNTVFIAEFTNGARGWIFPKGTSFPVADSGNPLIARWYVDLEEEKIVAYNH